MNPSARAAGLPMLPHASRPSLFATHPADSTDAQRILPSLLPQPMAKRVPLRLWWAGVGMTALALLGALYGAMPPVSRALLMRADAVAKPVASTRAEPRADARVVSPEQVARIESGSQSSELAPDPFREMTRTPDAASPALVSSSPGTDKTGRGEAPAKSPSKARMPAAPSNVSTARRRADSDVDLLEAVVAHVSRPASVGQARDKPDKRDVVPRSAQSSETVSDLVQRCRAVGGLEGLLCRNRVCDGHWGSDAACPASRPPGPQEP